jgi:hypothetical protein
MRLVTVVDRGRTFGELMYTLPKASRGIQCGIPYKKAGVDQNHKNLICPDLNHILFDTQDCGEAG